MAGVVYGAGGDWAYTLTGADRSNKTTLTALTGLPAGVTAVAVANGMDTSLIVGSDGIPYGVGDNTYGIITGTADPVTTLTPLTGLPVGVTATAVSAGDYYGHSLALGSDGVVYGAGYNNYGGLTGSGTKTTLTPLTGLPVGVTATAISAGTQYSLALGSDGVPYGTGRNLYGALTGTGDKSTLTPLTGLPVGVTAVAINAGNFFSLVIGSDGVVYGTGDNVYGQLTGTGTKTTLTPLTGLPVGVTAVAISAGDSFSLVIGSDGVPYGTGRNLYGALTGTGDKSTLTPLTGLPAGITAIAIEACTGYSMVIGSNGVPYGTGNNAYNQITGTGDRTTLTAMSGGLVGASAGALSSSKYQSLVLFTEPVPAEKLSARYDLAYSDQIDFRFDLSWGDEPVRYSLPYSEALELRFDLSYGDEPIRYALVYSNALELRFDLPYGELLELRYSLVYDFTSSVQLATRFELLYGEFAQLSARFDLLYGEFAQLSARFDLLFSLYAQVSTRFDLAYNLDANARVQTRFDVPYSLLAEQVAQVQSGLFVLRTTHG